MNPVFHQMMHTTINKLSNEQISSKASQHAKQDENDTMSGQNVRFCITCSDK